MKTLTRQQFLACQPGLTDTGFNLQGHRGQIALAFGRTRPFRRGQYLDLDLVAGVLVDEFTPHLGRKRAAEVILWTWPLWVDCVRRAEAKQCYGCLFVVGERDMFGRSSLLFISGGTADEVHADYLALPAHEKPPSAHSADMLAIVRAIREDAERAGVMLSDPLVSDTPLIREAIVHGQAIHDSLIERYLARGKRIRPSPAQAAAIEHIIERIRVPG